MAELNDKSARLSEALLTEALSLDIYELEEKCGFFKAIFLEAAAFVAKTFGDCTFKTERYPPLPLLFLSFYFLQ
jgi:hypothetical protein